MPFFAKDRGSLGGSIATQYSRIFFFSRRIAAMHWLMLTLAAWLILSSVANAEFRVKAILESYELTPIDHQGRGTVTLNITGSSPNCHTQEVTAEPDGDILLVNLFEPKVSWCNMDLRFFSMSVDFQMSEPPRQIIVSRLATSDGLSTGEVLSDFGSYVISERVSIAGDANFDGIFDSADLTSVFQAGQYNDNIVGNSTWFSGDWNGDWDFTSADLVAAFQSGKYVVGPATTASSVPEAVFTAVWLPLIIGCLRRTHRTLSRG